MLAGYARATPATTSTGTAPRSAGVGGTRASFAVTLLHIGVMCRLRATLGATAAGAWSHGTPANRRDCSGLFTNRTSIPAASLSLLSPRSWPDCLEDQGITGDPPRTLKHNGIEVH